MKFIVQVCTIHLQYDTINEILLGVSSHMNIAEILAKEFNLKKWQVDAVIALIDAGNTIPFIARYRKEATGELDDTVLRDLFERLTYLRGLEARKEEVLRLIDEQGKLTDEIAAAIAKA